MCQVEKPKVLSKGDSTENTAPLKLVNASEYDSKNKNFNVSRMWPCYMVSQISPYLLQNQYSLTAISFDCHFSENDI